MIHQTLKQSTRDLHVTLESKLRILLRDDLTLEQYTSVLKKFFGFYQPLEGELLSAHGWDNSEFDLPARLKLNFLIGDLAALGVDPSELAKLPICDDLPNIQTAAEALGCLYVLEGSTLGGKIITGHLTRVLAVDVSRGCRFFNSYGTEVGQMWSSFLGVLERHCERHRDADVVIHSARQTFECLDRWFSASQE